MTSQISITRALAEIKVLDKRIENGVNHELIGFKIGDKFQNRVAEDVFRTEAKAAVQQFGDLLHRREILKSKVVQSNAVTKVTIAGMEYTVAEAIERKSRIPVLHKAFTAMLNRALVNANHIVKVRAQAEDKLQALLTTHYGKDAKTTGDDYDNVARPFWKSNEPSAVDPIGLEAYARAELEKLQEFTTEVDFSLSEVNAKTTIEV